MAGKFNTLGQIYNLTSPADLSGELKVAFGTQPGQSNIAQELLSYFVSSTAGGVRNISNIKATLEERLNKTRDGRLKAAINELFSVIDRDGSVLDKSYWTTPNGVSVSNVKTIIGESDSVTKNIDEQNVGIVLIRTPFVHPSKRNTNECDLFLNSMPSIFASRIVPYLNVEFQTITNGTNTGLMKFLMGSKTPTSPGDIAINAGNMTSRGQQFRDGDPQHTSMGMEMFTSPQTLTNMNTLESSGGDRYVDVIDPFRPFASIDQLNVSVVPAGAGTFTYKKATLTMKLHDRSRLVEFSELITPKRYKDVVVWLTYGWLAPPDENNEYSKFVNEKMLQREAYGIVNSSFTFDTVGQVTVNVELFTKGVHQLQTTPITGDAVGEVETLRELAEEISKLRKLTLNEPPEGIGKDLRIYQMLDSAQAGSFPDMNANDAAAAINELEISLNKSKGVNVEASKKLVGALRNFYGASSESVSGERSVSSKKTSKFNHKEQMEMQVTNIVKKRFDEVTKGPDPFLPTGKSKEKFVEPELSKACEAYVKEPLGKNIKIAVKKAVSFGKLFSTFVLPPLLSKHTVDEIQLIFYALNEQCGPVSLHSIAEFPVDMTSFIDQYRDHVASSGGERMSISEFMQLVVNSQFMDNRAIGYGLRTYYEPYDSINPQEKTVPGKSEKQFESALAAQVARYGGFKKPNIDMYVETLHVGVLASGEHQTKIPLIDQLGDSIRTTTSKDSMTVEERKAAGQTTILRIHVYDKQLSPYQDAESIVKVDANGGTLFATVNTGMLKNDIVERRKKAGGLFVKEQFTREIIEQQEKQGTQTFKLVGQNGGGSSTLVRDYLANTVPKITFGTNGSTVLAASLASKQDPLLSTVNMLKNNRIKNTVSPNGAGDYGLPMRVVPASLTLTTLGCPLAAMAQQYYIDFQTGTTLDNLYIVTGLAHMIAPGKFESSWTMSYSDAYGRFVGAQNISDLISDLAKKIE